MKIAFIVLYLVVAIAMIAFIMLQRGSGAAAGSGFGAGASGTVFGSRGSSNFLSKSTKWLAVLFFLLSLGMAVYEARIGTQRNPATDVGVMGQLPAPADVPAVVAPITEQSDVPTVPQESAAPAPVDDVPVAAPAEDGEASNSEQKQP